MLRLTCILVSRGLLPVLLLAWMLASAGTGAADGGQAEIERLKQRVNGYFSAVHSRQLHQSRGIHPAPFQGHHRRLTVREDPDHQPPHPRGETGRGQSLRRRHHHAAGLGAGG